MSRLPIFLICLAMAHLALTPARAEDLASEPDTTPAPAQDILKIADRDQADRNAVTAFQAAHGAQTLFVDQNGLTAKGTSLVAVLTDAGAYGLNTEDFRLPKIATQSLSQDDIADAEKTLTLAALKYARYARGGRIADPAGMLNSNLDRRPQWIAPEAILDGLATASDAGAYLISLHPKHPQFERLRQLYVQASLKNGAALSASAKRLRANMEMWRWMGDDMGAMHVLNNIPEFMQRVYKDGQVIRSEKIVAGMVDKPSSIFSRPLKYVVLRPKWKVPESIKVNELWPSLIRGGGYMRQYGLQLESKSGEPLDYRRIDWRTADVRNYEVTQPPGPRSVLGNVKFSFPSQHTIFMHDTPDKWMFRSAQRTHSHGCLRVWRPMELAEIILKEDLVEQSNRVGAVMLTELQRLKEKYRTVGEVRGRGLLLGIELVEDRQSRKPLDKTITRDLYLECLRRGLVAMTYSPTIRLNPPLVITEETARAGLAILDEALGVTLKRHGRD